MLYNTEHAEAMMEGGSATLIYSLILCIHWNKHRVVSNILLSARSDPGVLYPLGLLYTYRS